MPKKSAFFRRVSRIQKKESSGKRKVNRSRSRSKSVPKKRRSSRRRSVSGGFRRAKSGFGSVLKSGIVGKLILGVGAATVVGIAVDRFAPQFSPIARPIAAFLAGGPVGAIGSILINGIPSFLGGGSANGAGVEAV